MNFELRQSDLLSRFQDRPADLLLRSLSFNASAVAKPRQLMATCMIMLPVHSVRPILKIKAIRPIMPRDAIEVARPLLGFNNKLSDITIPKTNITPMPEYNQYSTGRIVAVNEPS